MSVVSKHLPCALVLALLALSPSNALAQPTTPRANVLPSGGGAALLDASDTVILLLDHQEACIILCNDISIV